MKINTLLINDDRIYRILDTRDTSVCIIDCGKKSVPKWVDTDTLSAYRPCSEDILPPLEDLQTLSMERRRCAYERFSLISCVLPFITDKHKRCSLISQIASEKRVSIQTIQKYLWLYLAYQNLSVLAPKTKTGEKELSPDEKNIRWALNRFYYTRCQHTLNTAYTLMLKEKYCDENGKLSEQYPSFYQFRYFYRKYRKMQNYYIAREGIKSYQRNHRPILGDGTQAFASSIGFGMLDSTICDIYLVNEAGNVIGRPILTACVDGYSGLCCGYSLSLEGGIYSLRSLMLNVIADKQEWCKKFGIEISATDWNCSDLPSTIMTDMGKEYTSDTFAQLADLGVTVINLPPYRPDLKGKVEKFFDVIQNLYKPYLKGKGVIDPDFQERGGHDYRKYACLTLVEFEKIILYCIIHYNTKQVLTNFPYTEKMLSEHIQPFSNCIWNHASLQPGANLIPTDYTTLVLTLLPRTTGKFTRRGLVVSKLRYRNDNYTEQYLTDGKGTAAYNPDDVSEVWLIENGNYIRFQLIENRFRNSSLSEVSEILTKQQTLKKDTENTVLQAKIDLVNHISVIAENASGYGSADIRDIRKNRNREQKRTHIDYVKGDTGNG